MRRLIVTFALLVLVFGVVSLLITEVRFEEEVIDEWKPDISKLYTEYKSENETNSIVSCFILRARGNNKAFRQLLDQGKISELLLEVNVSASGNISVTVGIASHYNYTTKEVVFSSIFFNSTGTFINEVIKFNILSVDLWDITNYLIEIRNRWTDVVYISGYTRLKGGVPKTVHPYYGFGTFMCLLGFLIMIYGFLAKPRRGA